MKAVILAGGHGTRLSEETGVRPKPMVEIGHQPIIWHIMQSYAWHGIRDFIVCCGYRGEMLRDYFLSYIGRRSDLTVDLSTGEVEFHRRATEPWRVTLVDTGLQTMTGGRLRRVRHLIEHETFCLTYGDGLSDLDVGELVVHHRRVGASVTLTAVRQPGRFGALTLRGGASRVEAFAEKRAPDGDEAWINGGFFVVEPSALDLIDGDATVWEREPLERLAAAGELAAFRHHGFWQAMDTLHDRRRLEGLWNSDEAPWAPWRGTVETPDDRVSPDA